MSSYYLEDIEAVVFDLGGVVIGVDFDRAIRVWSGYAARDFEDINRRFTFTEAYAQHERGEIDGTKFLAALRQALDLELSDRQLLDGWNAVFTGVVPGVETLLERTRTHRPIYLFSNTNPAHQREWSSRFATTLAHFSSLYTSHELGHRKPEAEAYETVTQRMGCAPAQVLFFDDSAANVAGARAFGWHAVRVRSIRDVESSLNALLPADS